MPGPSFTRPLNSAGPYGSTPGAAPPFHAAANDPADQSQRTDMSRVSGQDVDPLGNAAGPVGLRSWDGGNLGYTGRDVTDSQTWGSRPYAEAPGMLARLQQEAQMG